MDKNEGIMIFKDTMEYLVNGLITPEQYAELTKMIYNTRWNGATYNDSDIQDKMILLIWKTLKHSIQKSTQNARAYAKKLENRAQEEPIKEEAKEVIVPTVDVPKTAPKEAIQQDLSDTANDILDMYGNELYGAYRILVNDPSEKDNCQRKWDEILSRFNCQNDSNPIRGEIADYCFKKYQYQEEMNKREYEEMFG